MTEDPAGPRGRHSRLVNGRRLFWWTDTLWHHAVGLEPFEVALADVAEVDLDCWFGPDKPPTVRAVAEHARRIAGADRSFPVILAADGGLMDGGHRIAQALLVGATHVQAVQVTVDPEPDWVE